MIANSSKLTGQSSNLISVIANTSKHDILDPLTDGADTNNFRVVNTDIDDSQVVATDIDNPIDNLRTQVVKFDTNYRERANANHELCRMLTIQESCESIIAITL